MASINDVLYDDALYGTSHDVYFFYKYVCLLFLKGYEWNDQDAAEAKQA